MVKYFNKGYDSIPHSRPSTASGDSTSNEKVDNAHSNKIKYFKYKNKYLNLLKKIKY